MAMRRFRISRIVSLWLQVVFYTVLITYIFSKLHPAMVTAGSMAQGIPSRHHIISTGILPRISACSF
jgi:hypothetical protein